jgi:hypothetical protein
MNGDPNLCVFCELCGLVLMDGADCASCWGVA